MNRELKFRAFDKKDNLMSRPFGLGYRNIVTEDEYYICDDSDLSAEEIETIEYTGLKDKNGVEIYEGYVMKTCYGNMLVKYDEDKGCWKLENKEYRLWSFNFKFNKFEIIGNVFENPELLNGKAVKG